MFWLSSKFKINMWTCPICSRQFRNTNQDHSCELVDLESHFVNKQQHVVETFDRLKSEVLKLEGVRINSVKSAILFRVKRTFLAVKPKSSFLDIEFILDEKIEEFPIHKTVQASKSKWAHFMRIGSPEDVDEQLIMWIGKAYEVGR